MGGQRALTFALGSVLLGTALLLTAVFLRSSQANRPIHLASSDERLAPLQVPLDSLDFGEVWEQSRYPWTLPIRNTGEHPVVIDEFLLSCGGVRVEPPTLSISPGETREGSIVLDLTAARAARESRGWSVFAVTVAPKVRGPDAAKVAARWKVQGRVRAAVEIDRSAVDFGAASDLGQPLPAAVAIVKRRDMVARLDAMSQSGGFDVTIRPEMDHRYTLTATPKTKLPLGEIRDHIWVYPLRERRYAARGHHAAHSRQDHGGSPGVAARGAGSRWTTARRCAG